MELHLDLVSTLKLLFVIFLIGLSAFVQGYRLASKGQQSKNKVESPRLQRVEKKHVQLKEEPQIKDRVNGLNVLAMRDLINLMPMPVYLIQATNNSSQTQKRYANRKLQDLLYRNRKDKQPSLDTLLDEAIFKDIKYKGKTLTLREVITFL